jgi:glycosyltransferase involved in cell wall biosynthesis
LKIALLTTDNRQHFKDYRCTTPYFGMAPEALLQGFTNTPEVEVHVVSCARVRMESPEKLASNIYFHSVRVPRIGWMRTLFLGCAWAVRKKLKEIQPELVHGQGTEQYCSLCAILSGFPNVVTIHGNMAPLAHMFRAPIGSYEWLAARLENFTLARTAGVLCNSQYTQEVVQPRTRRTWRVPNAIRNQFFEPPTEPINPGKPILINVGVISPRKRQIELLNVIHELGRQGLNFEFQFVGYADPANPYASAFLEKIKPLEKQGVVRFVGSRNITELIRLFDAASAMVHYPSEEAFGLVVAEALARNLKFFGSRTGGIVDIANDVDDAELFDTEDWNGLTSAMARWMHKDSPRPSETAPAMQARYSPIAIAQRHIEIYREVLRRDS